MDYKESWEEVVNNDIWCSAEKSITQVFDHIPWEEKEPTPMSTYLPQVPPKGSNPT